MARCITCNRHLSPYGVPGHRAAHRRRREECVIELKSGTWRYDYRELDDDEQESS